MGISESLAIVILIGFSIDYVVHLSSEYLHSAHASKHDKMKETYETMGISILSGWGTTFGSGIFLYGAEMEIFKKFAIIITCTVSISFIAAVFLFGAIMHAFGPEDGCGDIKCKRNKSE